jgi:hypothetical protein
MDWITRLVRSVLLVLVAGTLVAGSFPVAILFAQEPAPRPVAKCLFGPDWSISTSTLLERLGLADLARHDPADAFSLLEQGAATQDPDCQRLLALAELADHQADRTPGSGGALLWSRDAAVYAVFCLTRPGAGQGGEAIGCDAREVHNRALARCLRLARTRASAGRSDWPSRLAKAGIVPAATVPEWAALGLDSLQPAEEFALNGPHPIAHRDGLGVPLIAQRRLEDDELTAWKPYGPRQAVFAATAVIRPRGPIASWRDRPVDLMLYDPLREQAMNLGGQVLPLAHNLTSPLVRRLAQGPLRNYEYLGVVDPEYYASQAGAYAIDPYQPGKVPVVLVQGLWSNPGAWLAMLNALRADPVLRASYQFWIVLFPSGDPLPVAALSLRRSLREVRQRFDPQGADPALDEMVILGKSTGGQTVRMLAESSGEALWNAIFTRPIDQVRASPELRDELAAMFFFEPEPYIRRVIFLATAHRGGKLATQPGVRLGIELIRRNNPLRRTWAELEAANGPDLFRPPFHNRAVSSVDGLEAENRLLMAIDAQPIAPGITYHSIIANIRRNAPLNQMTDGLVSYSSAHLDGAASECIVAAGHSCDADPEVIAEMRRILRVHLDEAKSTLRPPEQYNPVPGGG